MNHYKSYWNFLKKSPSSLMLDHILKHMNRKPAAAIKVNAALLRDILFCSFLLRMHNRVSVEKSYEEKINLWKDLVEFFCALIFSLTIFLKLYCFTRRSSRAREFLARKSLQNLKEFKKTSRLRNSDNFHQMQFRECLDFLQ